MPGLMEMLFGSKGKMKKLPNFTPEQQGLMDQMMQAIQGGGIFGGNAPYQAGMGYLQDLYSQSPQAFARMQEPYMRQFQQQTVPGLAERFSEAGGRHSSAFNQAMGQAGQNLSANLGGMFEQMRSQNLGNLYNMSNLPFQQATSMLGQRPFGYMTEPETEGLLGPTLGGIAGGFGMGGSMTEPGTEGLLGPTLGGIAGGFGMGGRMGLANMFGNWMRHSGMSHAYGGQG